MVWLSMMRVVSDASVLIHLARIGYFRLLKDLYGEVVIATGVYSEVVERGWGLNQYHGSVKFNNFHNFSNRDETGAVAQHR